MKNKKGDMEEVIKVFLWVLFFAIVLGGLYYLLKNLTT